MLLKPIVAKLSESDPFSQSFVSLNVLLGLFPTVDEPSSYPAVEILPPAIAIPSEGVPALKSVDSFYY